MRSRFIRSSALARARPHLVGVFVASVLAACALTSWPAAAGPATAAANESPAVIVLLDATRDMAADKGARLDAQRHALEAVAEGKRGQAAFAAYGGKDCGGFRRIDSGGLNHVQPMGRRNLAAALEAVVADAGAPTRVLAIVGGANQCLAALCAKATQLKRRIPGLIVDVVGLGMTDDAARGLACVAANTGGRFVRANVGELATTLALTLSAPSNVLAALPAPQVAPKAKPRPEPSAPAAIGAPRLEFAMSGPELSFPRGLRLTAALAAGEPPIEGDLRFDLLRRDADGVLRLAARTYRTASPLFDAPPGPYVARVVAGETVRDIEAIVPEDGVLNRRLTLNAGRLSLAATVSGRPVNGGARFSVERLDAPAPTIRREVAGSALLTLPAGRYKAVIELGEATASQEITVQAGALTPAALDLSIGFLRIEGMPADAGDVKVLRFGREVARSSDPRPLFRLPPGAYRIASSAGAARAVVVDGGVTQVDLRRPNAQATPLTAAAAERRLVAER